jgi:hypothetical protein
MGVQGADDYLDKVNRLAGRLGARDVGPEDLNGALEAVRDVATVDVDAPTGSARREGRLVKSAVKRLTSWYLTYLAEQVNDIAYALLRLGEALVAESERTESTSADILRRLQTLEEKVRALSAAGAPEGRALAREEPAHED